MLNDENSLQNSLLSRLFADIFHRLNFAEEHKWHTCSFRQRGCWPNFFYVYQKFSNSLRLIRCEWYKLEIKYDWCWIPVLWKTSGTTGNRLSTGSTGNGLPEIRQIRIKSWITIICLNFFDFIIFNTSLPYFNKYSIQK